MLLFNKFYSPLETTSTEQGKRLLIIRHAKSSWDISSLSDFERPLNDRGKKDATEMARRLLNKKISIDAFISSPAKRARKTATLFCEKSGRKESEITLVPELYHAPAELFFEVVKDFKDKDQTVAIFSHNPGITDFVNQLVKNVRLDNMPTCGVFAVNIPINHWADFAKAEKDLWFFDYPKNLEEQSQRSS